MECLHQSLVSHECLHLILSLIQSFQEKVWYLESLAIVLLFYRSASPKDSIVSPVVKEAIPLVLLFRSILLQTGVINQTLI